MDIMLYKQFVAMLGSILRVRLENLFKTDLKQGSGGIVQRLL